MAGLAHELLSGSIVVIEPDDSPYLDADDETNPLRSLPALFVSHEPCAIADVVVEPAQLPALVEVFERTPLAAMSLTLLLRGSASRSIDDGLIAESLTYSMLQGGPEFEAWRRSYQARSRIAEIGPAVQVEDHDETLVLTLSRPHVHNAFSRRMRDELSDALILARTLPDERPVVLRGAGRSFCSGGDLHEFGSFPSIVESHLTRLSRSPARLLAAIAHRTTVELHGASMGAGIELPAYAARIVAAPDTVISLPEINLGLVPGAGGTVSIPRRIGRQRTAWLALTGERIDVATALDWGLVDEVSSEIAR